MDDDQLLISGWHLNFLLRVSIFIYKFSLTSQYIHLYDNVYHKYSPTCLHLCRSFIVLGKPRVEFWSQDSLPKLACIAFPCVPLLRDFSGVLQASNATATAIQTMATLCHLASQEGGMSGK